MRRIFSAFLLFSLLVFFPGVTHASSTSLVDRLKGRILLQVESRGEAWYLSPKDGLRYYMRDGDDAYELMRVLSTGITNTDLAQIPSVSRVEDVRSRVSVCLVNTLASRMKGRILLQIQSHGEAWYVDPVTCHRVYMQNGDEAYRIMQLLSFGISTADIAQIPVNPAYVPIVSSGGTSTSPPAPAPTPAPSPTPAPAPAPVQTVDLNNPFSGEVLYRDDYSRIEEQAEEWEDSRPEDADLLYGIADEPIAVWFGDWNDDIYDDVNDYVNEAAAENALPVLVAYAIPNRDCGPGYSAGGVEDAQEYHDWISDFANGIGSRKAIVILEPDAVALDCFDDERAAIMEDAVDVLEAKPNVSVYIDAGHPNWTPADEMAERLTDAGIDDAQGFALNVSNFYTTESNIEFGEELSEMLDGKHFIIDTSRNANGWEGDWCNPPGAGVGESPTTNTGVALLDALLWVKTPGSSDGYCHGGPAAGYWWDDYAIDLIENSL